MIYEAYLAVAALFAIGLFCVTFKSNLVKKVMGLGIIANSIHMLYITIGYRGDSINPIVTSQNAANFALYTVDPIPQALVLTAIVIDMCVTSLALIIIIWVQKRFGTVEAKEIKYHKG